MVPPTPQNANFSFPQAHAGAARHTAERSPALPTASCWGLGARPRSHTSHYTGRSSLGGNLLETRGRFGGLEEGLGVPLEVLACRLSME